MTKMPFSEFLRVHEFWLFNICEISVKFRGKSLGKAGGNIGKFFSF